MVVSGAVSKLRYSQQVYEFGNVRIFLKQLRDKQSALKELNKVRLVSANSLFYSSWMEAINQNKPIDNVYVVDTANKFTSNYQVVMTRKYVLNNTK
ncbi:hypothetical protein NIES4071_26460 [Calothrix sp. NIES-4071]|nr:hypothetical protein NIES4071_26460 [Calothrix sp. NIES-4071]BAZ56968.1 hypothetical protein NIES4105_26400 [Calothrix sp. NIES-4105]